MAHFDIPLDLPHAGRIIRRIVQIFDETLDEDDEKHREMLDLADRIDRVLFDASWVGENPPPSEANAMRDKVAAQSRQLVDLIEETGVGYDRLGQCIRNLFECLEMGEEGAELSLRAGENPDSLQRPV